MTSFQSLHLTEKGFRQAENLYESIVLKKNIDKAFSVAAGAADWTDFDSIYLFLYELTLIRRSSKTTTERPQRAAGSIDIQKVRSHRNLMKVEYLLEMDLENEGNPRHFLSEFAVHSLIDFRSAFLRIVELEAEVVDIDVGCVMIVFDVYSPYPENEVGNEDAREFVERRLSSDHWIRLSDRFSVSHQWINGSRTF